jgi:hypothetical protein
MQRILRHRPQPATIISCIALAVALSGTSYAAFSLPKHSVGTAQLKNDAVTKKKINAKTLGVLRGTRGVPGPRGPTGGRGPAGPQGSANGPAGGDLGGSYPNPTIAAGAIRASKLGPITTVEQTASRSGVGAVGTLATCPAGSVLISGGGFSSLQNMYLSVTKAEGNAWRADAWNPNAATTASVTAYAYCLAS